MDKEEQKMKFIKVRVRQVEADDVEKIAEIEEKCFPPSEAASLKSFFERLMAFPESFLVAELPDGTIVGHINGCVTDSPELPDALYHNTSLHQKDAPWQTVFGLAVLPQWQHCGIARQLLEQFIALAKERGKEGIVLTCKDHRISFYEEYGFVHRGVSESSHGGAKWNDMVLTFQKEGK